LKNHGDGCRRRQDFRFRVALLHRDDNQQQQKAVQKQRQRRRSAQLPAAGITPAAPTPARTAQFRPLI
jgi:hypothetical protein